MIDKFR